MHNITLLLGDFPSNDATELSNKCLQSIEVSASKSPVASMMADKLSPSMIRSTATNADAVASRNRRTGLSGNYLKLNLRKKSFSRFGTRRQALSRLQIRRSKFAKKFGTKGRRVGNSGSNWGSRCPKNTSTFGVQLNEKETEEMELDYARVEWRIADLAKLHSQFPEGPRLNELLNIGCEALEKQSSVAQKGADLDLKEVRAYMNELMHKMGIRSFRPGQERAIWRTLAGKSTLLVMPTASGKSLCYQIPAAIFQVSG